MSRGACLTLGLFCLVAGVGVLALTTVEGFEHGLPGGKVPIYGLAIFTVVIGWACLFPWSRPITLRIISGVVCLAYLIYVASEWGDWNVRNAIMGFLLYGLPGGYVALAGKYPHWGRHAAAFAESEPDHSSPAGRE